MIRKLVSGNCGLVIENLDDMARFAEIFSKVLCTGDFVALTGTLGTGKTTFTQFLCQSLGVAGRITSPTFSLFNEYETNSGTLIHGDIYRLDAPDLASSFTLLDEILERADTILLLEWADKAPQFEHLWTWHVHIEPNEANSDERFIQVKARNENALTQLMKDLGLGD